MRKENIAPADYFGLIRRGIRDGPGPTHHVKVIVVAMGPWPDNDETMVSNEIWFCGGRGVALGIEIKLRSVSGTAYQSHRSDSRLCGVLPPRSSYVKNEFLYQQKFYPDYRDIILLNNFGQNSLQSMQ